MVNHKLFCKAFLLTLFLSSPVLAQTITWTKVWSTPSGSPGPFYNGYHNIRYDPFTKKVWIYSTSTDGAADSIYSTRFHYFDTNTFTDTLLIDRGQPVNGSCLANERTLPGTRHPVGQFWVDEIRNKLWVMQGVCSGLIQPDQFNYQLTSPPAGITFNQVFPAHLPVHLNIYGPATSLSKAITSSSQTTVTVLSGTAITDSMYLAISAEKMLVVSGGGTTNLTVIRGQLNTRALGSIASGTRIDTYGGMFMNATVSHDTIDDAFFLVGYDGAANSHSMQVYCDTTINPRPGVLTPAQQSVGCTNPDDWTDITKEVGTLPTGIYYPNVEYDSVSRQLIQFGGLRGCCNVENQTWTYKILSKKWTNRNPKNPPQNSSDNNENGRVASVVANGKYYYHLTSHTPSFGNRPSRPPEDWVYNPVANTWTRLSVGQGPFLTETMTFDKVHNRLIAWAAKVDSDGVYRATGIAEFWVGQIH